MDLSNPKENTPKKNEDGKKKEENLPLSWMVKDCYIYKEEYKDCKSFKDRFHQYFVNGEMRDCSQWKKDYDDCQKWENEQDIEALQKVIDSERERVRTRLKAHFANDTWERRESPPENWNSELPEEIRKDYENSFLQLKANEIKSGVINFDEMKADTRQLSPSCTIS